MDIRSGASGPAGKLSNFAPHPFIIDGVECNSMEGFLQSLKFKGADMQEEVCKLVGRAAKKKGSKKNWQQTQTLYWRGVAIPRKSNEYQELLDRAFAEISKNTGFQKALLSTGNAKLSHSMGRRKKEQTVLTQQEFCSRLTQVRETLKDIDSGLKY